MGLVVSIIGLTVLIILAIIGASVPALHNIFGVVIPYAAIGIFILGIIWRVVKWARVPVPFRITTTCGQEKSFDWIKQNKLDNPSGFWGVVGRMLLEVLLFRSLFRNTRTGIKDGKKLIYSVDIYLWFFALLFHWSFLIIVLRHFRFFVEPVPGFVHFLQGLDGFFQVGLPIIFMTDALIIAGLVFLAARRLFDRKVKYISLSSDYFPLLLILAIAVTGIMMRYFFKTDLIGVKEVATAILSFSPVSADALASLGAWFYVHFFLVCSLLIYFPMSKLVHMPGVFMSPTRNLANNNRMKHHENPWKNELNMPPHTYEEYEDEFRDVMAPVGLPLDKEVKK
jgi:nitrate reductase gamma subunit